MKNGCAFVWRKILQFWKFVTVQKRYAAILQKWKGTDKENYLGTYGQKLLSILLLLLLFIIYVNKTVMIQFFLTKLLIDLLEKSLTLIYTINP